MIFLDLVNLTKIRRAILYIFCVLGAQWLQTTVFSRIAPLGVKPFVLPVLAVAIGMWEGGVWGGGFGMLIGLLGDAALVESTVTFLILFTIFGFFAGVLGEYFINRSLFACLILSGLALLGTAVCQCFPLWLFQGSSLNSLLPVAGLQSAWSLPFAAPAYFLTRRISGKSVYRE